MTNLTKAQTLARRAAILAQQVKPDDPTVVLLNPANGEYYTLEGVGSRIWQLCDGKRTIGETIAVIGQEFDASSDVIEADVLDLMKDLVDEGLVEVVR